MSKDDGNSTHDDDEQVLEPLASEDTKEFEDTVLKDPDGAEHIRTED